MDKKKKRNKKLSVRLISLLVLAVLSAQTILYAAGRQEEALPEQVIPEAVRRTAGEVRPQKTGQGISHRLTDEDNLTAENENFALYLNPDRMIIKLLDKSNEFIWSSAVEGKELDELTGQWRAFAQSLLVVEYLNEQSPTTPVQVPSYQENGGDAQITYMDQGFRATLNFPKAKLQVDIVILLEDFGLTVSVPDDSIRSTQEEGKQKLILSKLYIMPFFGAVAAQKDLSGYLMIPDGCGALIEFGEAGKYSQPFTGRIYGQDLGVVKENVTLSKVPKVASEQLLLPVYGIANGVGRNAFLAVITEGDEYAELVASPAGVRVDYFWAGPKFVYREAYFQSTGTGSGFSSVQKQNNPVGAKVEYYFLNGADADYTGMARCYQDYLQKQGNLQTQVVPMEHIPFYAEAVMADLERSLFGYQVKSMTTLEDAKRFVEELTKQGVQYVTLALKGFEKGGLSGAKIDSFRLDREVGKETELKQLWEQLQNCSGRLLLSKETSIGYERQISKRDLCYRIDRMLVTKSDQKELFSDLYFTRPETVIEIFKEIESLPSYKRSLNLENIGNLLVSDYKKGNAKNRTENQEILKEAMKLASNAADYVVIRMPNAYALGFADAVTQVPMNHSQYLYETSRVPFLQTVLSGYLPMYSVPLNYGSQKTADILQLIDYNMYPSYLFTQKSSSEFKDTNINDIYSSRFDDLVEFAARDYQMADQILSEVIGEPVISRYVPKQGVSCTVYANGKTVVVNYTAQAVEIEGTIVAAESAAVFPDTGKGGHNGR